MKTNQNSDFIAALQASATIPIPCAECDEHRTNKLDLHIGVSECYVHCLSCGRKGKQQRYSGSCQQFDRNGAIINWNLGREYETHRP